MRTIQQRLKDIRANFPFMEVVNKYFYKREKFKFPDHCFIPEECWLFALNKKCHKFFSLEEEGEELIFYTKEQYLEWVESFRHEAALVEMLGTWAYSKGIYKFDPELYAQLKCTPISENIPSNVLLKIPEYCIYVETPNYSFADYPVYGFLALISYSCTYKTNVLKFLTHQDKGCFITTALTFNNSSTQKIYTENIKKIDPQTKKLITSIDKTQDISELHNFFINLLLYICSENNKYSESESAPSRNLNSEKIKKGLRLFQAPTEKIHSIGEKEGELIRKFEVSAHHTSGWKVKPHIRRAHWHGVWHGKGREEFKYNWIPPTFVNNTDLSPN